MTDVTAPALIGKATYHLHPDDVDAFKGIMNRVTGNADSPPGNLFFHVAQDVGDPTTVYLVEGWDSGESAAAYLRDPGFQALLAEAMALRIRDRRGEIYFVSGAQEMPMPT